MLAYRRGVFRYCVIPRDNPNSVDSEDSRRGSTALLSMHAGVQAVLTITSATKGQLACMKPRNIISKS